MSDEQVLARREGLKLGFDLFSHWRESDGKMVITINERTKMNVEKTAFELYPYDLTADEFYADVDKGNHDYSHTAITLYTPWRRFLAWVGFASIVLTLVLIVTSTVAANYYVDQDLHAQQITK